MGSVAYNPPEGNIYIIYIYILSGISVVYIANWVIVCYRSHLLREPGFTPFERMLVSFLGKRCFSGAKSRVVSFVSFRECTKILGFYHISPQKKPVCF